MTAIAPSPRMCVVVTTYARPDGLARLLDDIEREFPEDVDVRVYDDASATRDVATERRLKRRAGKGPTDQPLGGPLSRRFPGGARRTAPEARLRGQRPA